MHIDCESLIRLSKTAYFYWMTSLVEIRAPKRVLIAPDTYVPGSPDCEAVAKSEQFKTDLRRLKKLQPIQTITVSVGSEHYEV